ncbi:uracil-xanthine permease family protein [uncultured Eubacterium sp.]|uniref:uracil-xanthine permease family protein n=1 Tax=uncultured Eubacterium sp. TaxID=165185 RepID=UPI0025ED5552|nr:solute carrier family 23 protein [uncultured Eubacterium sp.]
MKLQKMPAEKDPVSSVYHREGPAPMKEVIPLSIQHVIAMIIGCMTPAVIVANYAGLDASEKVILIQGAFIIAALSTFFQSYKVGKYFGSGIPTVMGLSFAFLPSLQAMAQGYGIACILGAQIIGGLIAILIGWNVRYLMKLFPPLVTGTVVFVVGLSLYPTAVTYMAGGDGNPDFGSWQNWLVAIVTLLVVFILNNFAKGVLKLSSILGGIVVGYILAAAFGMVDFSSIGEAAVFQTPKLLHFGLEFDPAAMVTMGFLYLISSIQMIGDFTATTYGAENRMPTNEELRGGLISAGVVNIAGALFGGLPASTYAQNVGIVTSTKAVNKKIFGGAALIILAAGLIPKFSALLTTIPSCVLGGATVCVFGSITMTGIKLIASEKLSMRNTAAVGLAVAIGMGVSQVPAALAQFPEWVSMIFGKSPVVLATIIVVIVNQVLPKEKEQVEESDVSSTAAVKTRKQTEQKTVTGAAKDTCRV